MVNDLRGDDPSKWRSDIPTFARVRYADVYPGIAMDYHGTTGTLEYDFRARSRRRPLPDRRRLPWRPRALTDSGALVAGSGADRMRQAPPVAFQPSADGRDPVPAHFTLAGDRVGFELGAYDSARPLVIDPLFLNYSTLLGGGPDSAGNAGKDHATAIAVDSTGHAFVVGETFSTGYPTSPGAYQTVNNTASTFYPDAFVTKLNATGSAVDYSTYLGGHDQDVATGVDLDSSGRAVVTGYTRSTQSSSGTPKFPVTPGAYSTPLNGDPGNGDVFVVRLNATGTALDFSSVFGGYSLDHANGIALDSADNIYVAGAADAPGPAERALPDDPRSYQPNPAGTSNRDGFVTKLSPSGKQPDLLHASGGHGRRRCERDRRRFIQPRLRRRFVGTLLELE